MTEHHEHDTHDHTGHGHAAHGPVVHAPPADAHVAHRRASEEARPDAHREVVRVDLEAREMDWEFIPGRATRAWGLNGRIPGPTIEARVGDVLEVKLTNRLSEPTTIHWHGLRVPAAMDGTDMVQRPIAPGETFTYRFKLPDAGTFWYHPHSNETVQMERGLYGPLIVRGANEPVLDGERVLVLEDVKLDRKGQIPPPGWWIEQHTGREGNVRLVNGKSEPELTIAGGQVERWRVVNAASARYIRLSIGGRPFRILGTDGGFLEAPVTTSEVLLAPADRVDVAVGPFAEGETLTVEALPYDRGHGTGNKKPERFATLRVGPAATSNAVIPERLRTIVPLAPASAKPNRDVTFSVRLSLKHGVDFLINGQQHHAEPPVRVGELQIWDIINNTMMDHPFHLHGFFFQVLSRNGAPPAYRSWEDTENVPAKSRIRIAWMPDDRCGGWMYHCHILEHHEAGMMAHFDVVPAGAKVSVAPSVSHEGHHHH